MEFILLVEGHAEKKVLPEFLKRRLDARLKQRVAVKTVNMDGFGNFKKDAAKKARMHLEGPDRDQIIAVIGLIDLYGPEKSDFYPSDKTSISERYNYAKEYL